MRFGIPIQIMPKDSLENAEIEIPIDYDAYFLSLIKTGLSAENNRLFKELFEKPTPKYYSTSVFFQNARFTKDSIILNSSGNIKLYFSTANTNLAINFYNAFIFLSHQDPQKLSFGKKYLVDVKKLYTIELPKITTNKVTFKTMSPIVVRNNEGRFISCASDATEEQIQKFNKALQRNTLNKLKDNQLLASTVKELEFKPLKMRKTVRKSFGLNIECSKGIFELSGNPTLLNFIQEVGLGEKTGSFSGMISLAN